MHHRRQKWYRLPKLKYLVVYEGFQDITALLVNVTAFWDAVMCN
jgi:hypothetical protein